MCAVLIGPVSSLLILEGRVPAKKNRPLSLVKPVIFLIKRPYPGQSNTIRMPFFSNLSFNGIEEMKTKSPELISGAMESPEIFMILNITGLDKQAQDWGRRGLLPVLFQHP